MLKVFKSNNTEAIEKEYNEWMEKTDNLAVTDMIPQHSIAPYKFVNEHKCMEKFSLWVVYYLEE